MKKIIIVNNNMNVGGVQKALINLLNEIADKYEITLLLFSPTGEYMNSIPASVKVISCNSLFRCLGLSQTECKHSPFLFIIRAFLVIVTKLFGRKSAMKIILCSQRKLVGYYDCAISYLQNGANKSFYGGCNEFVLKKISAERKTAFLHCDYRNCGADYNYNNELYREFDIIAACSEGCRQAFLECIPDLRDKTVTVPNCHNYEEIRQLADLNPIEYDNNIINIVSVARLSVEKGIDRGIRAISKVISLGYKVHYHVVGDGVLRVFLQELVIELGLQNVVTFYGNTYNPYRYMKNADLLLIPSYHEAAPLVIDEAFCLGVPVVSTETTSSKDMILDRDIGFVSKNTQEDLQVKLVEVVKKTQFLRDCKNKIKNKDCSNLDAVKGFMKLLE